MTPGSSSWGFLTCDPEFGPQPRPPLVSALKGVGGPETSPFCSCRNVSRKGPSSVYSELQVGSLLYAVRSATNQRRASGLAGCDSDRQLPLGQSPSMPGSVTCHVWHIFRRGGPHDMKERGHSDPKTLRFTKIKAFVPHLLSQSAARCSHNKSLLWFSSLHIQNETESIRLSLSLK